MSRIYHKRLALISLAVLVTGCDLRSGGTLPPLLPPTNENVAADTSGSADHPEIPVLLSEAELALDEHRLTTPVEDSAYYRYLRVLTLDPGNPAAEAGIAAIVEQYLIWALAKAEAGYIRQARHYLASASSVDDRHPGILSVGARIDELAASINDRFALPTDALNRRNDDISARLGQLAQQAAAKSALVIIRARTDAEGRWIYQQMNNATELRVRARLELSPRPMVLLVYEDDPGT